MGLAYFYSETAPYVSVLSWQHISYLAVCGIVIMLFLKNRAWVLTHTDTIGKVFLWVMLFQQTVLLYGWYAVATGFNLATALPLHISRVTGLFAVAFLLTKRKAFLDITCYFSIFALVSLFYPMNVYHFAHVSGMSYMISHLLAVLMPLLGVIGYGWRPTWKSFRNGAIGFMCYFPMVLLANALIENANYFYQTVRPFWMWMPSWLFGALSFIATITVFAVIPLIYSLMKKRSIKSFDTPIHRQKRQPQKHCLFR